ncbi:MAG: transglycosylase SLT domain-containing protein [Ardenticatenaceae bacterium]|nr:transglycosylase SLT domain-containing protein [Ardenticatenaceae bacterium]
MLALTLGVAILPAQSAPVRHGLYQAAATPQILSPYWGSNIRQWSMHIGAVAQEYGLDPDLIAAVIQEESHGDHQVKSWAGAVGLMGVMPAGPGLEWRPSAEELMKPSTNLHWGVAILSEIIQQSGGDFFSALAAYSGGWELVDSRIPRLYAGNVLDHYGRAVAARSGISPKIATQWTVAIEQRRGNVSSESLLVLGQQPISGLQTYGEHIIYDFVAPSGRVYAIRAYAVPVALVVPLATGTGNFGLADAVEAPLQARLGQTIVKVDQSNPQVLLACLPSLGRLRGRVSTRWYAPSQCPSWHR